MTEMLTMNGIQAINAAMFEAMAADPKVLVLGEDIADREGGGVTGTMRGLSTKFGDHRVRTTPISEQATSVRRSALRWVATSPSPRSC